MSYTALYRKLRPKIFDDVLGQAPIVKTLRNQINSSTVSHAYLFCGTRGTGKTSTAKIFSRAINCLSPQNGNPCNECTICVDTLNGRNFNIIEIDAASNNGVDNIREIIEEAQYAPTNGKYKVYIIDEVHMLSTGAFNALLKTLEEPPAHVIFILATTDPQKLPATILSRCQRFDFKRITEKVITEALKEFIKEEKVLVSDDALAYIARIADGAMRDALSILDQCMGFYFDEEIDLNKVLELLGAVDPQVFFDITDAIYSNNAIRCIEIIDKIITNGRDLSQFISDLIIHLRNLVVAANSNDSSASINTTIENIAKLCLQGKAIESVTLIYYINTFADLQSQLRYATNQRIMLEITCIKLCNPQTVNSDDTIFTRLKKIEDFINNGNLTTNNNTNMNIKPSNVVDEKKK